LEPGRRPQRRLRIARPRQRFNGARFFWNREDEIQTYTVHSLARASMGPGSFGTGKPWCTRPARARTWRLQWGPVLLEPGRPAKNAKARRGRRASMGPGSFGTGKWRTQSERERNRARRASMGPGSFGTGKIGASNECSIAQPSLQWGPVLLEPGSTGARAGQRWQPACRFNGARFFWNREAGSRLFVGSMSECRFNGARFFWNREGSSLRVCIRQARATLQWGPVLLEPGSAHGDLLGPGRHVLQWGPVLLEPGRPRSQRAQSAHRIHGFNGARFFWNREVSAAVARKSTFRAASMGPGSFGTGKR